MDVAGQPARPLESADSQVDLGSGDEGSVEIGDVRIVGADFYSFAKGQSEVQKNFSITRIQCQPLGRAKNPMLSSF